MADFSLSNDQMMLSSSCIGLSNGYHWLKPLQDDMYPPIHALCSDEYMVLDVHHDANLQSYFESFDSYHYALSGADHQTSVNWQQWFLPSAQYGADEDYGQFLLSPDCAVCDGANDELQQFSGNTAYYMTGTMFGCLTTHKAERDCSWDWDSYQCKYCTMEVSDADLGYHVFYNTDDEFTQWADRARTASHDEEWWYEQVGLCGVYPRPANTAEIARNREQCFGFDNQYNPSLGNDGRYCVCYKPPAPAESSAASQMSPIDSAQFFEFQTQFADERQQHKQASSAQKNARNDKVKVVELFQSDFLHGTYRITQPGTYRVMEDIVFDFNAGDVEHPNDNMAEWWWPKAAQRDGYLGADSSRDEYFMGFFAGVTIEADDVVLDLNGHELAMSRAFYYQQRFFACIALKSVAFNLNQGPGIFGAHPVFANNAVIRDGVVGLSSHHGIHGHNNNGVLIENVHVRDFETHGIELSAFNDVTLKNVEIGPSSTVAYLTGEYAFARFTLRRLERIQHDENAMKKNEDIFPFTFANREEAQQSVRSVQDIIDRLRSLMNEAFRYVVLSDLQDESLISDEAKQLFINEDGLSYGAVMYGLFLNLHFANVFQIHPSLQHSHNAVIENVAIHGLVHKTREYLRLDELGVTPYANPYNAALDAQSVLGAEVLSTYDYFSMPWDSVQYVGDALTDAHIVLDMYANDWNEKGLSVIGAQFSAWAQGLHQWSTDDPQLHPYLGCNNDRMTHTAKGVMGVRIDGVEDIVFDSLRIYDLHEQSPLGSTLCGPYWDGNMQGFFGTGHFLQNSPYLLGYTGNMVHGIFSDFTTFRMQGECSMRNLRSDTGLVNAIGLYTSSDVEIADDTVLRIEKLAAGTALSQVDTTGLSPPYQPAVAKPFHIVSEFTKFENVFYSMVRIADTATVQWSCLSGRDGSENDLDGDAYSNVQGTNCEDSDQFYTSVRINHDGVRMVKSVPQMACFVIALSVFAVCCLFRWIRTRGANKASTKSLRSSPNDYNTDYGTVSACSA